MRRHESREARFSNRTLMTWAAASLPETLSFRAGAADAPAEILLYDEIGFFGVTASDFAAALSKIGDGPLTLRINSPGGEVYDGYAIYNMLRARKSPVAVIVDGVAASAASFIAMAGETLTMGEPALLMIHNCMGFCIGNRHDMLDTAAVQEKIDGQIAAIYSAKSGMEPKDASAMMDAETWLTSAEAKAKGLCDAVLAPPDASARAQIAASGRSGAFRALARQGQRLRSAIAPYDPDDDGDNDAIEAIGHVTDAMSSLSHAMRALNPPDAGDGQGAQGAPDGQDNRRRGGALRAAATSAEWQCGAARDLTVDDKTAWDGPAAAERLFEAAGFNGDSPDPARAKRGFLAWDHHNPKLKGSYKLPFADFVDGKLTALKSGLDAAASRLPDTDIPDSVKTEARAVIDGYEAHDQATENARRARLNRLRLAEAEAA